jgi:hypothetical protein
MLISENERFRQEINPDQRHSSFSPFGPFSALFRLFKSQNQYPRFGGENEKYLARVFSLKTK